jgi:NTE family protein
MIPEDLRASDLFYGLSDEELELVIARLKPERYAKGQTVIRPDEPINRLYFVESGRLQVTDTDTDRVLGYLGPGSFFGEITAFLPGQQHAAGLEVVIDATLFSLSHEDLQDLLLRHPQMALRFNYTILRRFIEPPPPLSSARSLVAISGQLDSILKLATELSPFARCAAPSGQRSVGLVTLTESQKLDLNLLSRGLIPVDGSGLTEDMLTEALSIQLEVFRHVLVLMPEAPTPIAGKALDLAEAVVAVDSPARWVEQQTPSAKLWRAEAGPEALARLARRIAGRRLGLVLSSGGSKCVAHVGVLKTLRRANVPIDLMAGASGGALFGAAFALGFNDEELLDFVNRLASMNVPRFWDLNLPPRAGLLKAKKVRDELDHLLDGRHFSDLEIPLVMIATDIQTGEMVELDSGPLSDAIRASFSLPGIADPWHYQNRYLIDGGLINPLPTDVLRQRGADVVVASDVTATSQGSGAPRPHIPSGQAPTMFQVLSSFLSLCEVAHVESKARLADVMMRPGVQARSALDFNDKDEFLVRGEAEARRKLPDIFSILSGTPLKVVPEKWPG